MHQIAGHQIRGIDGHQPAVAPDHRVGREHVADRRQRILGLALLNKADGGIHQHDAEYDAGVEPVLEQRGHQAAASST